MKKQIKNKELKTSIQMGKSQQLNFEESRNNLEKEYHKIIEQFIKREREQKKEQTKKRQLLAMVSDSKAGFKGTNALELEKQIKLMAEEEISDRTPIIEALLEKWRYVNKCKKYLIEEYGKNANKIFVCFER